MWDVKRDDIMRHKMSIYISCHETYLYEIFTPSCHFKVSGSHLLSWCNFNINMDTQSHVHLPSPMLKLKVIHVRGF